MRNRCPEDNPEEIEEQESEEDREIADVQESQHFENNVQLQGEILDNWDEEAPFESCSESNVSDSELGSSNEQESSENENQLNDSNIFL